MLKLYPGRADDVVDLVGSYSVWLLVSLAGRAVEKTQKSAEPLSTQGKNAFVS